MDADELALARTEAGELIDRAAATDPSARTAAAPHAAASAARLGARLGRYALLRRLGEGAMGVVYAAYDEELDRRVALKVLRSDAGLGSDGHTRLLREAQSLARLSHPNVVQVHQIGEHEGQLFVAMEFVEGTTLDAWQRAAPRPLPALLDAYRQAAEGLLAAHRAGLVHRDFKPENVLVGVDGRVRVADFGLARRHLDASAPATSGGASADPGGAGSTAQGALIGTPAYMSPEQFEGRPADARSDVFSFSVALWEAIHGQRPFAGRGVHEIAANVLAGARRPPQVDLPARLRAALERGLAIAPEERLQGLEPLRDALAVDPAADPTAAASERRLFARIVAALAALLATALAYALACEDDLTLRHGMLLGGGLAVVIAPALLYRFRRTLLQNRYHRRLVLFMVGVAVITSSQRTLGLLHDVPTRVLIFDTLHIIAGMSLVAAIAIARWMAIVTAITGAAIALAYLRPDAFPVALLFFAPLALATVGYGWRRDAGNLGANG